MMIQNTRSPPTNKRSLSLTDYNKTHTDFNSRLIIGTPACELKTNIIRFKHHHHSNFQNFNTTSYNTSWNTTQSNIGMMGLIGNMGNMGNMSNNSTYLGYFNNTNSSGVSTTNSIKLRLQKVLGKQTKSTSQAQSRGHKKIKSLFFKGNYKLNKNKKQLEQLNKKNMAQIIQRQNQQLKKNNRQTMFVIKQMKPIKFKTSGTSNILSRSRNTQYDYQDQFQLFQQASMMKQNNQKLQRQQRSRQRQGQNINTNTNSKQMKKVIQYFDRYDKNNGYKSQQKREYHNDEVEHRIGFNTLKGKMKRRITIRNKKNQEYQPWELDHSCDSPDHF